MKNFSLGTRCGSTASRRSPWTAAACCRLVEPACWRVRLLGLPRRAAGACTTALDFGITLWPLRQQAGSTKRQQAAAVQGVPPGPMELASSAAQLYPGQAERKPSKPQSSGAFHLPLATCYSAKGSALIAVFWMIAILGMVVFSSLKMLDSDTKSARITRDRMFAKRYAEMGLEVGRHPQIELYDPLLYHSGENGGSYQVTITTEEARFNINTLLLQSDRTLLKRIFVHWGAKTDDASKLCDVLKDWVDADDLASLNGAEKRDYERMGLKGMPYNRPFKDLDEVLLVKGLEDLNALKPGWRDWFTVFGDGRVDINEARAEFLSVLADVPMERVQPVITFRAGRDGAQGTIDDAKLSSAVQLAQMLGVFQPKIVADLQQWVQFQGPIRRIESVGSFNDLKRKIVLITQNNQVLWRGEMPNS